MFPKMMKNIVLTLIVFIIFLLFWLIVYRENSFLNNIYTDNFKTQTESSLLTRHNYGVIIDAGSSGSRLFIYTWPPHSGKAEELLNMTPMLDTNKKPIVKKVNPGLSSLADQPDRADSYIKPLLDLAAESVPKDRHKETPLYIMATAGMRMISDGAQKAIFNKLREFVKQKYNFLFSDSHAKVISGKEEGIFGWITTNYLLGRFNHDHSDRVPVVPVAGGDSPYRSKQVHHRKRTVGVIDMGGGSMQIAYELPSIGTNDASSAATFNLGCKEDDVDHTYRVFVTTFLGFGANSARTRYERMLVRNKWRSMPDQNNDTTVFNITLSESIDDPCLHPGLQITSNVRLVNDSLGGLNLSPSELRKLLMVKATFRGTGRYHQCEARLQPLLDKRVCETAPSDKSDKSVCTMAGRLHPNMDLGNTEFYGFSEFWYSTNDVLGMGGPYNYFRLHSRAVDHCNTTWFSLQLLHKAGVFRNADWPRMRYQCFKSAWITTVLHTGLGFPNSYGKFTSVNEINGAEVQWTLGALLYQTRYFPLRAVEEKMREIEMHQKSIRNQSKHPIAYILLLIAIIAVFLVLRCIHYPHSPWLFPNRRKNGFKNSSDRSRIIDTESGPIIDLSRTQSVPNFRGWM